MHYEVTIDDPGAYERPWVAAWDIRWGGKQDLQEYICQDDNQYLIDLKDEDGTAVLQGHRRRLAGSTAADWNAEGARGRLGFVSDGDVATLFVLRARAP